MIKSTKYIVIFKWLVVILFFCQSQALSAQNEEEKAILKAHNKAREEVGVQPLVWADSLEQLASEWATYLSKQKRIQHRTHKGRYGTETGENIAITSNPSSLKDGFLLWVVEKQYYHHRSDQCIGGDCGHYTQIVWKKTKAVGCAKAATSNGGTIIVCNYSPGGNVEGEKPY